ncbi:MAG: MmgE/PrpD family protein [Mesorhizobium sp.]|nr:MAG: MmgE/PrpD family protein [Mesorhizobium sp.]
MNPLFALAKAAGAWRQAPISPEVDRAVRRALLDWFATMLPGCAEPPARLLAAALVGAGQGAAVCYVGASRTSARQAALINATASHVVEFDDIFKDGGYHPGSSTIAAALALAQEKSLSRESLHRAIIAGYEAGCRLSLAVQPSHYTFWHTSATVGTIGAAVATAMLLECDDDHIAHAIALASSFAGGHQQNLQGEGMAKALHAGHAAEAGLLAGLAAAGGITASPYSLHGPNGFAAATSDSTGNWAAAFDGIGAWTPITRMTVKNHGCCGHIFPALDGLRILRAAEGLKPAEIASISVAGYAATKRMCDRSVVNSAQEARFSLQYCLAADLMLGTVRLEAFTPRALARRDIRQMMPRIAVVEDAELAAAYPRRRMARLVVDLVDGRQLQHLQQTRKGDPEDPLSDHELVAKYEELVAGRLDPSAAAALRDLILDGSGLPGDLPVRP